jgi:uncharacterized NAD-dependent epimerase/dehydratase family protein
VTLGLLHGSQPDALVLCHDPTRSTINEYPDYRLPALEAAIEAYLAAGRLTNPAVQFVGVSLNTSKLDDHTAAQAAAVERDLGFPCFDPLRFGVDSVVDRLVSAYHVVN